MRPVRSCQVERFLGLPALPAAAAAVAACVVFVAPSDGQVEVMTHITRGEGTQLMNFMFMAVVVTMVHCVSTGRADLTIIV